MSDIIADLMRVNELLASKTFPQAIWFINRDYDYYRLERAVPKYKPSLYRFCTRTLGGMPVHQWDSTEIKKRMGELMRDRGWQPEQIRHVFPFCQPGIWVQMSNGKHQHIELTN